MAERPINTLPQERYKRIFAPLMIQNWVDPFPVD